MSSLKESLSSVEALTARIRAVLEKGELTLPKELLLLKRSLTDKLRTFSYWLVGSIFLAVVAIVDGSIVWLLYLVLGACILYTLYLGTLLARFYRDYANQLNQALMPAVAEILGQPITYQSKNEHSSETKNNFQLANLVQEPYTNLEFDGRYQLASPLPLSLSELQVTRVESQGKHTNVRVIFHGLFVVVHLQKTLDGITYLSTKSEKGTFTHNSFWSKLVGSEIRETNLEWNQFDQDLHVATSDGTEARYILTPDFMLDLHEWWTEHKENIRLVFKANRLFILLPDRAVHLGYAPLKLSPEKLQKYLLSITKPIWRVLTLVEDVKL